MPILTAITGDSSDLFKGVAQLYFQPGWRIADVTYGSGVFWRQIDITQYTLLKSDLAPTLPEVAQADCRHLPYPDASLHALVLDPPFMAGVNVRGRLNAQYRVNELAMRYPAVIQLYGEAILEATRVLRRHGLLIVKCQDIIESGKRHFAHITIANQASSLGLRPIDQFILVNPRTPPMRHATQAHARSNHTFFWVFKKEDAPAP